MIIPATTTHPDAIIEARRLIRSEGGDPDSVDFETWASAVRRARYRRQYKTTTSETP